MNSIWRQPHLDTRAHVYLVVNMSSPEIAHMYIWYDVYAHCDIGKMSSAF